MLGAWFFGFSIRVLQRSFENKRKSLQVYECVCASPRMLIKWSERFVFLLMLVRSPQMIIQKLDDLDVKWCFPSSEQIKIQDRKKGWIAGGRERRRFVYVQPFLCFSLIVLSQCLTSSPKDGSLILKTFRTCKTASMFSFPKPLKWVAIPIPMVVCWNWSVTKSSLKLINKYILQVSERKR